MSGLRLEPDDIKVRVWGMARWDRVYVDLLKSVGVNAFVSRRVGHLPIIKRVGYTVRELAGLDIEHIMYPGHPTRFERLAHFLGTKVVYHWLGSDVLALQMMGAPARQRVIAALKRCRPAFMADGPHLVGELAEMGIEACSVSVMPLKVIGPVYPMPERFTVLSYWGRRPQFYGSDVVLALAAEMKDVEFLIVGGEAARIAAPPNVKYLGDVDMEDVYRRSSVLVRMPRHDGTSKMLLEALSRGRWAIYSRQCPGTFFAQDLESARAAIHEAMRQTQPNAQGARYVRESFDPQAEAQKALAVYRRLLG